MTCEPAASDSTFDKRQQALREQGFQPGEPVHEFDSCFTLEEAQRSLFGSTYSSPIMVYLGSDDDAVRVPVVLDRAEVRYEAYGVVPGATPAGSYETPDWYFEGWIPLSGFDAEQVIRRVRIYVYAPFDHTFLWQVIPETPSDDEIRVVTD